MKKPRVALVEYVVRIMPPADREVSNEEMEAALATLRATLEHHPRARGMDNLGERVYRNFIEDVLEGFTVETRKMEE